ncbi:hypothetical protein ACTFIN_08175 [Clostridium cagae]|uniref:hypothetical protein n=1 Tax=Clostridium cagae TaxID=2080751 RepID=UPI003F7628E6
MRDHLIDIITCIITSLTSFITIFLTIRNTNKNQEKTTEIQNKHFYQSLKEQQRIFELNKKEENLRNAIAIMPYLKMLDDVEVKQRTVLENHTILEFPIELVNIGNGTAINVSVLTKNDEAKSIVFQEDFGDRKIIYIYNSFMFDNIVKCNELTTFRICCDNHDLPCRVLIKIKFQDMMLRTYEQEFSFMYQFNKYENKLMRIESYTPLCTNETYSNI